MKVIRNIANYYRLMIMVRRCLVVITSDTICRVIHWTIYGGVELTSCKKFYSSLWERYLLTRRSWRSYEFTVVVNPSNKFLSFFTWSTIRDEKFFRKNHPPPKMGVRPSIGRGSWFESPNLVFLGVFCAKNGKNLKNH